MSEKRLPPFPAGTPAVDVSGALSLAGRGNDEDIKRQLLAALNRIAALEARVTALETP